MSVEEILPDWSKRSTNTEVTTLSVSFLTLYIFFPFTVLFSLWYISHFKACQGAISVRMIHRSLWEKTDTRQDYISMIVGLQVTQEMSHFAPGCKMFENQCWGWIHPLINTFLWLVGVSWVTLKDWRRWGKWRLSTSTNWPWYMLKISSWSSRKKVRNRLLETLNISFCLCVEHWGNHIKYTLDINVRDRSRTVLCVLCVRVGPSGKRADWAEQHNSAEESADGA